MKTRILRLDPSQVDLRLIDDVARVLFKDGIVAYPTETFYGLGGAGLSAKAVSKIYDLKKRDSGNPLSLIVSDLDMVREVSASLPEVFWALAAEFWPGPLTIVVKAARSLPTFLTGPGGSVAVRVPPVAWIRRLVEEICQPLTATSANLSGEKEISDPRQVEAQFGGRVALIVDGGTTPGGAPSTVLDLTSGSPRVLREGAIPAPRIFAVAGA
jgi:L-threonylcarbamoyladenylate synthase